MRKFITLIILTASISLGCAQTTSKKQPNYCVDAAFDKKVSKLISFSVPIIDVQELKDIQNEVHIFDARERVEYDVSHIKDAEYIGYDDFNPERLKHIPKDTKIVLYCSIGYRSEKIGEKLLSLGYTEVYNLYGSIFEWVNRGNTIQDKNGNPTTKVHTYNQSWSKWLDGNKAKKVW